MRDDNNNRVTPTVKCETNHVKESIVKFTDKVPTQTWFLHRRTTSLHFAPQQIQEQNRYVLIELSFNFHVQFTNKCVISYPDLTLFYTENWTFPLAVGDLGTRLGSLLDLGTVCLAPFRILGNFRFF